MRITNVTSSHTLLKVPTTSDEITQKSLTHRAKTALVSGEGWVETGSPKMAAMMGTRRQLCQGAPASAPEPSTSPKCPSASTWFLPRTIWKKSRVRHCPSAFDFE